jgi:toxin secretion/phage lysis holin
MEHINKFGVLSILGAVGAFISALFGGWDSALTTLIIFMAIDYLTGLIVAGVFHNSGKSETGALESRAGWKGLCRKGMTLLIVLVAVRLDIAVGTSFIKDAVVIGYIANEALSIVENAGLMGLPIPEVVQRGIDVLRKGQKSEVIKNE